MSVIEKSSPKHKASIIARQAVDYNMTRSSKRKLCAVRKILAEQGFHTPDIRDSKQLDEYREIKRPLLINAFGKLSDCEANSNVVMITSALAGEGKTYTTFNLAMSMAMERDTSVMVVDCDDARSSLSSALGLRGTTGLTELLLGKVSDVEDIIVNTDIPKFTVISSGKMNAYSTELFASERMELMVNKLSRQYSDSIILFDSPPLLQTSQAKVLSLHVGQVLVVVEEGKTGQKIVVEAISRLDSKKIIGTILNKRNYSSMGDYYGGYYGAPESQG